VVSDLNSCFLSLCADVPPGGFFFSLSAPGRPCLLCVEPPLTLAGLSLPLQSVTRVLAFCLCVLTSLPGVFFFSLSAPGRPVPTLSPSALSQSSPYSLVLFLTVVLLSNFAMCMATSSLDVSSLTCRIWTIAAAPIPIAPSLSVGDPYFSQLCQYFVAAFQ